MESAVGYRDRTIMYWQRRIISGFSGQIAEGKFCGKHPRHGHDGDDRAALDMAEHLTGSEEQWQKYLDYCWVCAKDVVEFSWKGIQAVAAALLERETLKYQDVDEIISSGSTRAKAAKGGK